MAGRPATATTTAASSVSRTRIFPAPAIPIWAPSCCCRSPARRAWSAAIRKSRAAPGYYAVTLDDYKVRAELTTSARVGVHRYAFPKGTEAKVLLDLSTTAQINDSLKVGNAFLDEIKKINRLHKNSVEQAGFAVLKAPDIPSVLVETAFISNPQEEALLRSNAHQDKLAQAMMTGIQRYFTANPPLARLGDVS
ncbi:hypothetical protein G6F65_014692 [Rhizopus arrhizus]|nr:hypothetical protein G6F65_014692 [Rhizopus arrhizus]